MNKSILQVVMIVVVLLILGLLVRNYLPTNTAPTNNQPTSEAVPTPTVATTVKEFTITGSNFKFDPKEIRVKQGDRVTVNFTNAEGTHDFNLDEFNVKTKILKAGEQETVQFVADKTGTFEYYCSVGNHRQMGMVGNLVVE